MLVCVALVVQYAKRMRLVILSFAACLHIDTIFGKELLNIECVF